MKKILFLIHDLGHGGAEKVLVNLVNHMDRSKFDITVMSLFGGGVNEQFLASHIRLITCFPKAIPGNSHLMKLFSPVALHKILIKESYDIEIAYLEGVAARIVSGCLSPHTKKIAWIHCTISSEKVLSIGFRNIEEAQHCYQSFNRMIYVSDGVRTAFFNYCPLSLCSQVLYNTNESNRILSLCKEPVSNLAKGKYVNLIGVGKVVANKGFDRLARIHVRLTKEGYPVHTYILGVGPEQKNIESYLSQEHCQDSFTFLGYQTNPYKFISKCDLFVCASFAEGFSTAATEALIVGTPVCTVDVSGMKEMLGENNEYGLVVPNDDASLYQGIKKLLDEPELLAHYKRQAQLRGKDFSTERTVQAVEEMLLNL